MKLKIKDIIVLFNNGICDTTEHDVPVADAYKASKFRRELRKAFDEVAERERALAKDAGFEIGKISEATEEQRKRFHELQAEMLADEIELPGVKTMSYESYHILAKENRQTPVILPGPGKEEERTIIVDPFRNCEEILEGVLWVAPEE